MMLYGIEGPFDFRTYDQAEKGALDQQSGKNLVFPSNIQVSNEAKDLLRGLIEQDPHKRISWEQFFDHDVFKVGLNIAGKYTPKYELYQNVIFHTQQQKVEKLWIQNRDTIHQIDYVDPTKINFEKMTQAYNDRNLPEKTYRDNKIMINIARSRYAHEINVIRYLFEGAHYMRKMAKDEKHWIPLRISFMNVSIILVKYGLSAIQTMIESISYKNNIYNIEGFAENFLNSSSCNYMLTQFKAYVENYKAFLDHLINKMQKEFTMSSDREKEVYNQAIAKDISKSTFLNELLKEYTTVFNHYVSENTLIGSFEPKVKYQLRKAICSLFYYNNFETDFQYHNEHGMMKARVVIDGVVNPKQQHQLFNWNEFYRSMDSPDFVLRKLEELGLLKM